MIVYRISNKIYADDLNGTGAGLYGGRWNPIGVNLLYTSGSISLATLEYLVHNLHIIKTNAIALVKIEIPSSTSIQEVPEDALPHDWKERTYTPQSTQQLGLEFFEKRRHYALKVPSAIVPFEYNYLLNPFHESHSSTRIIEKIDPFLIDERLG